MKNPNKMVSMDLTELTDEQLMLRISSGDSHALETVYDRHAAAVMGVAMRVLGERSLAEEIVQETFWRVWDRADSFDSQRGVFAAWMFSIARRLAIDTLRRQTVRPQAAQTAKEEKQFFVEADPGANVAQIAMQGIQAQQVRQAVASLPPEQGQVIELAYFQGLTRKEIANATQNPLGTIHTRARLALIRLRSLLQSEEMEAS
jgi:RNA polymerase sigma-70 factor, ECF subfamily